MKVVAHVGFALLLVALQAALLRWVGGGVFSVALPACCIVWAGLQASNVEGSVAAAGIGYVLDLATGTPKGLMTFLAVALFLAARAVSAAVDLRGRAGFALLSGLGTLFLSVGATVLLRNTSVEDAAPAWGLAARMLVEAVLTAAAAPVIALALRRIDTLFHREEPGLLR